MQNTCTSQFTLSGHEIKQILNSYIVPSILKYLTLKKRLHFLISFDTCNKQRKKMLTMKK